MVQGYIKLVPLKNTYFYGTRMRFGYEKKDVFTTPSMGGKNDVAIARVSNALESGVFCGPVFCITI